MKIILSESVIDYHLYGKYLYDFSEIFIYFLEYNYISDEDYNEKPSPNYENFLLLIPKMREYPSFWRFFHFKSCWCNKKPKTYIYRYNNGVLNNINYNNRNNYFLRLNPKIYIFDLDFFIKLENLKILNLHKEFKNSTRYILDISEKNRKIKLLNLLSFSYK